MPAPFPAPNVTNIPEIFTYANNLTATDTTGGILGIGILVIMFVLAYAHGSRESSENGFAMAAFLTTLGSFFLGILGLVNGNIILVMMIITAFSVFILRKESR